MDSDGNFVNTRKINGFFPFQGSFVTYFATSFWFLNLNWRDLNSRLGGCGIWVSEIYFQFFWKIMKQKDWSDPQPNSAIQPKARGLLHMEHEYFAHHIWSRFQGLSTSQPQGNHEYLEDYSAHQKEDSEATRRMFWLFEVLEDAVQVLDACRTRLRRAMGLVRPGTAGLLTGIEFSRVRDSSWMYLTSFVTTLIGVVLAAVQGNYPIML